MGADSPIQLEQLLAEATAGIDAAADLPALDAVRVRFLGKSGLLTEQLKALGQLPKEQRPQAGQAINQAKRQLQGRIDERRGALERQALEARLQAERVDVTLPGRGQTSGGLHPVTRTMQRIQAFFASAGFEVAEGPEIEDDFHNFEALNIPSHHPARAMHDTFYFDEGLLLRTHTSPVQIRHMQDAEPPMKGVVGGGHRSHRSDHRGHGGAADRQHARAQQLPGRAGPADRGHGQRPGLGSVGPVRPDPQT